jgi:hypothetical protein
MTPGERRASVEVRAWYEERLRPRLADAVRLGFVHPRRLRSLDDDVRELTGSDETSLSRGEAPAVQKA